jgi:hypothetical protein
MRHIRVGLLATVASVALSSPVLAWGQEGHQIIALIAAHDLTPKARAGVARLLGDDVDHEMAVVSTWADEVRPKMRETAPWHYVDIPIGSAGFDASRDCPHDDCVVAQIERDEAIISDPRFPRDAQAEALKFLIHFVGDLHQPLHASDNHDRGGNSVRVVLRGASENLHRVWDTDVVEALGTDPNAVASDLEARITLTQRDAWSKGSTVDWANDSFGVASREIYAKLPATSDTINLADNYAAGESDVVRMQLEKAGVRLGALLNRAFR